MAKKIVKNFHKIICTNCEKTFDVDVNVKAILCPDCTMAQQIKLYGIPESALPKKQDSESRPAGWHFYKEFVDVNGNVYHKGVEQPQLKGTKPTTKIKPKKEKAKKLSPRQKEEKQIELFKEIDIQRKILNKLIKSGKKRGRKETEKKFARLKREVKKYL